VISGAWRVPEINLGEVWPGRGLAESPKVYVRDSGLVHALLGLEDFNDICGHPVAGSSWEGFVIENLLSVTPDRTVTSFYRTAAGAEIDLVLDLPKSGRWAIEIKRSLAAKPEKGFHIACDDIKPKKRFVVYPGEGRHPGGADVEVIGVREMMTALGG